MDATGLEQDGYKFAQTAVDLDAKAHYIEAIFFYKEAAHALRNAVAAGSNAALLSKADEYAQRVDDLVRYLTELKKKPPDNKNTKPKICQGEQQAKFLVMQAFEKEEGGMKDEALELYLQTAELCIKTKSSPGITQATKQQLEKLARQALERAEEIKGKTTENDIESKLANLPSIVTDSLPNKNLNQSKPKPKNTVIPKKPLGPDFTISDKPTSHSTKPTRNQPPPQPQARVTSQSGNYTKEELDVLRSTSYINKKKYLPFMGVDLAEKFAFPVPYTDKEGFLELAEKQKKRLGKWARPSEFADDPQMIMAISSFSIKQTVVSDCSFIASLAISAAYERRFRKKLITSIIYPQNKKGEPMYNPCGKYMVKLHLNGVPRKVVIDDYFPIDKHGELLCSYSSNRNEIWVSLIEKAYMKVMGGYDFPGSNSNIDLHALTGWIPERQSLRDEKFDKNKFFNKILERFHKGDCLATISTGPMTQEEEDRTGLVATHAYAVLDIRKVEGLQMLQLKNPWSHLRWKGRFGAEDNERWTPKLRNALNYDNKMAQQFDNGVFWIDYDSALHFYDTFYVSWNPQLFPKTICQHATWLANDGPEKDGYSLGDNPQYSLEVRDNSKGAGVWVLLTRHITDKADFAENEEFITLLVYKNEGNRVYFPNSPPPFIDGVRINSPHYLTRIPIPPGSAGPNRFTLVVSQYKKHKNIQYTVRVYSTVDFVFKKIIDQYKFKKKIDASWTKDTAGGCVNHRESYGRNPIFQINVSQQQGGVVQLLVELRARRDFSIGFDLTCVETKTGEKPFTQAMSGNFRSGYSMLQLSVPPGVYNLIPCTFLPNQEGIFILNVSSSLELTKIARLR